MRAPLVDGESQGADVEYQATTAPPAGRRWACCDGGFWTAVLTTANAALGAGVLAYPVAFRDAGIVGGSLLLLLFAVAASVGLCIVLQCMSRAQAVNPSVQDYTKIVSTAFGTKAELGVTVLILLYVFGACWGYLVLLADTITPLVLKANPNLHETLIRTLVQCVALSNSGCPVSCPNLVCLLWPNLCARACAMDLLDGPVHPPQLE
jgi:uncharacterized protein YneF (UPF0154 family)